jgi:UMF1 family MFS transporter
MYDWANSAYSTTVAAGILPIYFAQIVVGNTNSDVHAIGAWGLAISLSAFLSFLVSPVLGAIADLAGAKKKFMMVFAYTGALFTILLSFCGPGDVMLTLGLFVGAQLGFIGANVFYDAFITEIATDEDADWISGKGYSFGYIGGGLQFAIALILIASPDTFGLTRESAARAGIFMAGLWWAGFALIPAKYLKESRSSPRTHPVGIRAYIAAGVSITWATTVRVRLYRHLVLFLLAFMLYNDGIQTVIEMASIYGSDELGLRMEQLMLALLLSQLVAPLGALCFSKISRIIGGKKAIMLSLICWGSVTTLAYFIHTATEFFVLTTMVGIVLGASQALSRSYYSSMVPKEASAEFFGFYTVFSKFSAIWGPLTFAAIRPARLAILTLSVLFAAGLLLLAFVDERQARRAREGGIFAGNDV